MLYSLFKNWQKSSDSSNELERLTKEEFDQVSAELARQILSDSVKCQQEMLPVQITNEKIFEKVFNKRPLTKDEFEHISPMDWDLNLPLEKNKTTSVAVDAFFKKYTSFYPVKNNPCRPIATVIQKRTKKHHCWVAIKNQIIVMLMLYPC